MRVRLDWAPYPANFGTGAVKITPAHDPNDFMTGKRHNLEFVNMLTEDGLVNEEGGDEFKGMKRFTARKAVIAALDKAGISRWICRRCCSWRNVVVAVVVVVPPLTTNLSLQVNSDARKRDYHA